MSDTDPHQYIVPVPRDIESDILIALADFGLQAVTTPPKFVTAGTVRISRTGGPLTDSRQRDRPQVLVEVWAESGPDAYDAAIAVWGALRAMEARGILHDDVAVYNMDLDPPRALDDPQVPAMYRVQFLVTLTTTLTEIALESKSGI